MTDSRKRPARKRAPSKASASKRKTGKGGRSNRIDPTAKPPVMQMLPPAHRRLLEAAADKERALLESGGKRPETERAPKVEPLIDRDADGRLTSIRLASVIRPS